ncbi:MAG: NAD(P)-dependent glycerol-3-phosphate dehydrogenase [Proteobacteria bacterium]|nr:NAD(P)-dependent glycerol-3-phosphate dehydrogenase [Pseudomonadota bacterium]
MSGKSGSYKSLAVIGAGAWGTALGVAAALAGRAVTVWARESAVVDSINSKHENVLFLPGIALPAAITATGDMAKAAGADALLIGAPAQHLRATLAALKPHLPPRKPLVLCAKGIERDSHKLMTEVLVECLPDCEPAILSGPSFAKDVARSLPTAVTIAARPDVARALQEAFGHLTFRPYASDDLPGVALGGAAKNVYAIACGIVMGMGLGESARAALLSRSFAELCRLGEAMGARSETLMGLSGLGDLVLTATSASSRNYAFGLDVGKGLPREELYTPGRPLAEGIATAPALVARAHAHKVELPIAQTTAEILDGTIALADAVPHLMSRPLKTE